MTKAEYDPSALKREYDLGYMAGIRQWREMRDETLSAQYRASLKHNIQLMETGINDEYEMVASYWRGYKAGYQKMEGKHD